MSDKLKCNQECKYSFLGVFFVGVVLAGITANYYLNIEPQEERNARTRRIASEIERIHVSSSVANIAPNH